MWYYTVLGLSDGNPQGLRYDTIKNRLTLLIGQLGVDALFPD